MNKLITTKQHGFLDYLTVGTMMLLPKVLKMSKPLATALESVAAAKLMYVLFTDHELGVVRKIPMKAHLVMDTALGAGLCALPFVLGDDDDEAATIALAGMGLNDILVAGATQLTPTQRSLPRELAQSAQQSFQSARESVMSNA